MLSLMIGEDPAADIRWLEGLAATRELVLDEVSLLINSYLLLDQFPVANRLLKHYSPQFGHSQEFVALTFQFQYLADAERGIDLARAAWARSHLSLTSLVRLLNLHGLHSESVKLLSEYLQDRMSPNRGGAFAALAFAALNCESLDPVAWRPKFEKLVDLHYPENPSHVGGSAGGDLRIGFIGSTLHYHPITNFIAPLFVDMKNCGARLIVFSNGTCRDPYQDFLRSVVDEWYDVATLDDPAAYELMIKKRLDVLIDLDNHTTVNRLGVVGRRVAPCQASLYGLNSTTGVAAVDYRICDKLTDPVGIEAQFSEQLLRLPVTHICYDALAPVPSRDCRPGNVVRVGIFNSWHKVNQSQVRFIADLLRSETRLQLVIGGIDDGVIRQWLIGRFRSEGVDLSRIEIHSFLEQKNFFALAQSVDFAIDSWPWGGGATTAALLNLGVPVLARSGSRPASRIGPSLLWGCGFSEWVVEERDSLLEAALKKISEIHTWRRRGTDLQQQFVKSFGVNSGCGKRLYEALVSACGRS